MVALPIIGAAVALVWRAATKMGSIETKLDTVMTYLGLDVPKKQPTPRAQVVRLQTTRKKARR